MSIKQIFQVLLIVVLVLSGVAFVWYVYVVVSSKMDTKNVATNVSVGENTADYSNVS